MLYVEAEILRSAAGETSARCGAKRSTSTSDMMTTSAAVKRLVILLRNNIALGNKLVTPSEHEYCVDGPCDILLIESWKLWRVGAEPKRSSDMAAALTNTSSGGPVATVTQAFS